MSDGGVAGDPLGEFDAGGDGAALEQSLDPLVHEPQPGLHVEDRLSDDGEAEVTRLDDAGVNRTDRDLVDAGPLDGEEGVGLGLLVEWRRGSAVVTHRIPAPRPVLMQHQAGGLMMPGELDAEEVLHLAFETPRRERHVGQAGQLRCIDRQPNVEFDPCVRPTGSHDVDDPDRFWPDGCRIMVGGDEGDPVAGVQQFEELCTQICGGHVDDPVHSLGPGGSVHRANTSAALWTSREIGQIVIPSAAATSSPPTSGTRDVVLLMWPVSVEPVVSTSGLPVSMLRLCTVTAPKIVNIRTIAIAISQMNPSEIPERRMASSLAKMLNGGTPISATRLSPNVAPTNGRSWSRPRTPSIRVVPVENSTSPVLQNATDLASPLPTMCSSAAAIASGDPIAAARAIKPACSTLE